MLTLNVNPIIDINAKRGLQGLSNRNNYATCEPGCWRTWRLIFARPKGSNDGIGRHLEQFFEGSWIFALGVLLCRRFDADAIPRRWWCSALVGLSVFLYRVSGEKAA
jgi:hypothetical protein